LAEYLGSADDISPFLIWSKHNRQQTPHEMLLYLFQVVELKLLFLITDLKRQWISIYHRIAVMVFRRSRKMIDHPLVDELN
jgi:hypothetical protein